MISRRQWAAGALGLAFLPRGAGAAAQATFTLADERILIDVQLNGRGPYAFAIDSGAQFSGVLLPVARELGLREGRGIRLNGKMFPVYDVKDMVLGGAVRQQGVGMFGLEDRFLGAKGLVAAGMLTSQDSELDFDVRQWRIYPEGATIGSGFTRLQSEVRETYGGLSRLIYADATFAGVTQRTLLDTGLPWAATLPHALGQRLGLLNDQVPYAPYRPRGIQGPAPDLARVVRLSRLIFGQADYAPLVVVSSPNALEDSPIVGLPLLRTQNLFLQGQPKRLWVKRNGLEPYAPAYNYSGLWIDLIDDAIRVRDVGVGSPAAAAGVRAGDILEGVKSLGRGLELVGGPAGKPVNLKLRGPDGVRDVAFVLADYL